MSKNTKYEACDAAGKIHGISTMLLSDRNNTLIHFLNSNSKSLPSDKLVVSNAAHVPIDLCTGMVGKYR